MKVLISIAMVAAAVMWLHGQQPVLAAGQVRTAPAKPAVPAPSDIDERYQKVWVCKDVRYANVIEDTPGTCKPDGTKLVEIRMGLAYKCLRGPANIQADEGPCETDRRRQKGPVTVSVFWTCKDSSTRYLDPGTCSDGSPRNQEFEERPHGDHNTRHGGDGIIMSADLFHHLEVTYSAAGLVRVYFYNEFTKPMKVAGITGRIALENSNFAVTGAETPLRVAAIADGNALEGRIPNAPAPATGAPVYIKVFIKLKPSDADWKTDHQYNAYSVDPAPPAPAATTGRDRSTAQPTAIASSASAPAGHSTAAAKAAATSKAASPAGTTAASSMPASPATPLRQPVVQPPRSPVAGGTAMAGGAEVAGSQVQDEVLPDSKSDLLALLKQRSDDVNTALQQGQLGGVWFPAIGTKNVALALQEKHTEGFSVAQRGELEGAVKLLTVAAWQIDAAGDLGDRETLTRLYQQFASAVVDIQRLYGQGR